jgi:hypothetical protein
MVCAILRWLRTLCAFRLKERSANEDTSDVLCRHPVVDERISTALANCPQSELCEPFGQ